MADSPAKRHLTRVRAALEAARRAPHELMAGATAYEQHMAMLQQDRLRLKQVQSDQGKAELKRQMLPAYSSYVAGVIEAGNGAADEVVTTVLVWCIDVGDYDEALRIAEYALKHRLAMPDRFARTTGCLVAEEIAEAALKAQRLGEAFEARVLDRAAALTADQDMPDEVRAKLHLALGRALLASGTDEAPPAAVDLEAGIAHLRRAIDLHSSCGGKKDLERAERLLKKHAVSPPANAGGGNG
ncbi:phage terminase small subunit [Vulcaniibacterium tengchongense]|uniref:Small terminase subunit n=1 Tax=Vulcaniibacterium tengchongense TaxID=1273429 RepID=A0A3N4UV61_9GAMM|nr:phage terminase small subunit [Vulcaniibacterium tengchongense]RPE74616.1 small terminase subunit [Vulcaniibacterium tengchongense]